MTLFEALLNHTFTHRRRERVSDGQGGWAITYNELGTVKGRLRPIGGGERGGEQSPAAREVREIRHVFYATADSDVQRGDELEGDGVIVEVLGVREPSRAGHHLEIDCVERQYEATAEVGS